MEYLEIDESGLVLSIWHKEPPLEEIALEEEDVIVRHK